MTIELADEIKALIDGANFAHLATIMPDGSPLVATVWAGREENRERSSLRRTTASD